MISLLYLRCTYKISQNLKVIQSEKFNLSMNTMRKIPSFGIFVVISKYLNRFHLRLATFISIMR